MSKNDQITGVIEGFYGRQWSWQNRADYALFLAENGFNSYIYAPKGDSWLRKQWRQLWPADVLSSLSTLRAKYRRHKIRFGIGFSPYELYLDFTQQSRILLDAKLAQIEHLQPDIFCILFDDMRGDLPQLADTQLRITDYIASRTSASHIVVCPTYYSDDPVLDQVFGRRPANYLQQLSAGLDKSWDLFWTGDKVCSQGYEDDYLDDVAERLGRKPLIWDNYPVNDGRLTSDYLHLAPPRQRAILPRVSGLLANPMNQPTLSTLPLQGLAKALFTAHDKPLSVSRMISLECEKKLMQYASRFQYEGLKGIDQVARDNIINAFKGLEEPAAVELRQWMMGRYAFDPACLT